MAIWKRRHKDKRVYFDKESGFIKKQDSAVVIHIFGIPVVDREIKYSAEIEEKEKGKLGFNHQ